MAEKEMRYLMWQLSKLAKQTEEGSRPRLTLKHLHALRVLRDAKNEEAKAQKDFITKMYGGNEHEKP